MLIKTLSVIWCHSAQYLPGVGIQLWCKFVSKKNEEGKYESMIDMFESIFLCTFVLDYVM